jgi:hypothetical protein
MVQEDAEAVLREMMAPLSAARRGGPLPGVPFSREAVANAFVMLGLLPEARAEEILAQYRPKLDAMGFRLGVLTGELSVRPGVHGFQAAQAAGRDGLARLPLAVAAGPVPIPIPGMDLDLTWATLTPGGAWLRLRAARPDTGSGPWPPRRPRRILRRSRRMPHHPLRMASGHEFAKEIRSRLSVTDNLGRSYQVQSQGWGSTVTPGPPGERMQTWHGELLTKPETEPRDSGPASEGAVQWLELAAPKGSPVRVALPAPASVTTGTAGPPWPTPAECYLAALAQVTSMSISTDDHTVQLDTAQIVAAVAGALLRTGALPADSALLSGPPAANGGNPAWRLPLMHLWARHAHQRARTTEPHRAGLAVPLPLRQATAVVESITAHEDLVSIQLYGHPWVTGEYWPMITPCFQVRAIDDTGAEHEGVQGGGGGSPEGSWEYWFWPPIVPAARKIRVIVRTLWEAASAELGIPGRPA